MSEWTAHKAMLAALEHGTATPGQQRAAREYIRDMLRQHEHDMREERRDSASANERAEQRGEPDGTY